MIRSIAHLEFLLKCDRKTLRSLKDNIDSFYYEKREVKLDSNGNPKTINGIVQERITYPSVGLLKTVQKRIKKNILDGIKLPDYIQGGVRKRDNVTNAKIHLGKHYKFVTDLSSFFPSITHRQIYRMFVQNGFSADVSSLLTFLTSYKNQLPQGTPTSTHIANLVFYPTDKQIVNLCEDKGLTYTRFVDDLTFSSQTDFREICPEIISIIKRSKFKISRKKTHYRAGSMLITGVWVKQNTLNLTHKVIRKIENSDTNSLSQKGLFNYAEKIKRSRPMNNKGRSERK